jgi:hypothetical protein
MHVNNRRNPSPPPQCSYLYLKVAKMPYFSVYFLCFFFYKIGERVLSSVRVGELAPVKGVRWWGNGVGG